MKSELASTCCDEDDGHFPRRSSLDHPFPPHPAPSTRAVSQSRSILSEAINTIEVERSSVLGYPANPRSEEEVGGQHRHIDCRSEWEYVQ